MTIPEHFAIYFPKNLNLAIQLFLGVSLQGLAREHPEKVVGYFGEVQAAFLRPQVETVLRDALRVSGSLREEQERWPDIRGPLLEIHPQLSDDAIAAVQWYVDCTNR